MLICTQYHASDVYAALSNHILGRRAGNPYAWRNTGFVANSGTKMGCGAELGFLASTGTPASTTGTPAWDCEKNAGAWAEDPIVCVCASYTTPRMLAATGLWCRRPKSLRIA